MIEETATAKYLPSAFSSKLIGLLNDWPLVPSTCHNFLALVKASITIFLRLNAFLKKEIDSLVMEGYFNRNSIVAVSDDFVVLAW